MKTQPKRLKRNACPTCGSLSVKAYFGYFVGRCQKCNQSVIIRDYQQEYLSTEQVINIVFDSLDRETAMTYDNKLGYIFPQIQIKLSDLDQINGANHDT
jgi:ribosomal protein L37AE/L43A